MGHKSYCNYPSDPCDCGFTSSEFRSSTCRTTSMYASLKWYRNRYRNLLKENKKLKEQLLTVDAAGEE